MGCKMTGQETKDKLQSLGAKPGIKYSTWALHAHGQLQEHADTSGQRVWLYSDGACWADTGVVADNCYTGERTKPVRLA
jgi:hypothetical protein